MKPHPDFEDVDLPRFAELPGFRLTPLSPEAVEEDYQAVVSSAGVLTGLFGSDWPLGLTLEDNRIDLAWHDREFTARRSFAWIVRDADGSYLGCAYIYPEIGMRGRAEIVTWIRDRPDRHVLGAALQGQLNAWFDAVLPAGLSLRWTAPA